MKCLVVVFIVLRIQNECERIAVFYYLAVSITLDDSGTRNILYERFQNGCVLMEPLSGFLRFFQHGSGITQSEI